MSKTGLVLVATLLAATAAEFSLRLIGFADKHDAEFQRRSGLHARDQIRSFDASGLYPRGAVVPFRTNRLGLIEPVPPRRKINVLVCGGSVTEAVAVGEDLRWVALLHRTDTSFFNAGRSGKTVRGCTKTLNFLASQALAFDHVFVITSLNDFGEFLAKRYPSEEVGTHSVARSRIAAITEALKQLLRPLRLYQLLANAVRAIKNRGIEEIKYVVSLRRNCCMKAAKSFPDIENVPFVQFQASQRELFVELRAAARQLGARVVALTEAYSYGAPKSSFFEDFRQRIRDNAGHEVSFERLRGFFSNANMFYLQAARRAGIDTLDLAAEMEIHTNGPSGGRFVYDANHLTPEGSQLLAEILNEHLRSGRLIAR